MIHFLKHTEINKLKWDEHISTSHNSLIYAYSWYLDIVSPGWTALVNDDFTSVMPLVNNKKFGINYLFPPFFVQQLGVFSLSPIEPNDLDNFIKAIPSKYKYIEINFNSSNTSQYYSKNISLNNNLELLLDKDYESHFNLYSENTRRSIKKAAKNNLVEINLNDPLSIIDIFKNNRGKSINKLKDKHYSLLANLCKASSKKSSVEIIGVNLQGELIGGAVFFIDKKRAIFIFSATSEKAKENRAMFFLIDNFIKRNANSGIVLDFEGSNNENIARFYRGFGAEEKKYPALKINRLPPLLKNFKK